MIPTRKDFTRKEWRIIKSHPTPREVQRFLSSLPYNHEKEGATCQSFRSVIRENRAHCLEGALTAAVILEQHGYPPLLVSVESQDKLDHVLFLYKKNNRYGAVARSRDPGLHGRKPVFRTVRDLVMSYFDAYIDRSGRITGYAVASLDDLGNYDWRFSTRNVWKVERYLQEIPHREIRSSDARYQKWFRRYKEFKKRFPDRRPEYFPNRDVWMR
jgi:hypothetical protein